MHTLLMQENAGCCEFACCRLLGRLPPQSLSALHELQQLLCFPYNVNRSCKIIVGPEVNYMLYQDHSQA